MTTPIAYALERTPHGTLVFCPACSLRCTAIGLIAAGLGLPDDMDDAIARMTLGQIERGMEIDTPIALSETEVSECMACNQPLGAIPAEDEVA